MIRYGATLLCLGLAAVPAAAVPAVRVQGTLTDASGRTLTGIARLDFRIVEPLSKVELWSEPLEVEVVDGVFMATLGLRQPLPSPSIVRGHWKLVAEPPMGSGWLVGPLAEPEEDVRGAQLARLMTRLGLEPEPGSPMPAEYRALLAEPPHGFPPPEAVSAAPECAEGGAADTCPRGLQRVLGREERLLRARLGRLARQAKASPRPLVGR